MNKKGQLDVQIVRIYIFILVFALIIFGIWGAATLGPLIAGSTTELGGVMKDSIPSADRGSALDNATIVASDMAVNTVGSIQYIIYAVSIALLIGYIAICYYARTIKMLAFVWLFVIVGMIILSMVVSQAYVQASSYTTLGTDYYATWGNSDFMMRHLPMITAAVGTLSGLFLFVIMQREPEEEDTTL